MKRAPLAVVLCLSLSLSGCGTIVQSCVNGEGPVLYGGAKLDVTMMGGSTKGFLAPFVVLAYFDLPFSVALDTLLLPFTMPRAVLDRRASSLRPEGGR